MTFKNGDKVRYVGPSHTPADDETVYTITDVANDYFTVRWDENRFNAQYSSASAHFFIPIEEEEEVIPVRTRFEVGDKVASIRFNTTAVVAKVERDAGTMAGARYDRIEYGNGGWDRSTDLYLVSRPRLSADNPWTTVDDEYADFLVKNAASFGIEVRTITQYRKQED